MRVLAVSGSLRRDSHNTALLRAAAELAPAGVEVVLWDGLRDVPFFFYATRRPKIVGRRGGRPSHEISFSPRETRLR